MSTKANESPSNPKSSESLTSPTGILPDGFPPARWTPESRKAHHEQMLKAINENPDDHQLMEMSQAELEAFEAKKDMK